MSLCRFVIQLLEDLVFFVSDVPNNGQNVLDIVVTKPNRERQKLMREQNILKQVGGWPWGPAPQQGWDMSCGDVLSCSGPLGGLEGWKTHRGGCGLQLMHRGLVWSRTQP